MVSVAAVSDRVRGWCKRTPEGNRRPEVKGLMRQCKNFGLHQSPMGKNYTILFSLFFFHLQGNYSGDSLENGLWGSKNRSKKDQLGGYCNNPTDGR